MDNEDALVRVLAEGIYTDFEKYTLMDMEFVVSDLASLCAKDPGAQEKFNTLVTLRRQREAESSREQASSLMDRQRLLRLNGILREVYERGSPVDDLDEIPSWFMGTPEQIAASIKEVRELFDEAHDRGMLNRWIDDCDRRGPCTYWDWTTTAHRKASRMSIILFNPIGEEESDQEDVHG